MEFMALLIPILSIVLVIGLPMAIALVAVILRYRRRKQVIELHHAERMAAIERGMEIPPLPSEPLPERRPRTGLFGGLMCSLVGAALIASWAVLHRDRLIVAGMIVAAVGIAHLIYYAIEGRKLLQPPTAKANGPREELR